MQDSPGVNDDILEQTEITEADKSHIQLKDAALCRKECRQKPCLNFCPTNVFTMDDNKLKVNYERCIECGACPWGCPEGNINWSFPPGGYGVCYRI